MKKLLVAIVASAFVFSTASGFAGDAVKKEELTQAQRMDMHSRADKLTQERAQGTTQVKPNASPAPKAKTHHVRKVSKVTRHGVKKTHLEA